MKSSNLFGGFIFLCYICIKDKNNITMWKCREFENENDMVDFLNQCNINPNHCQITYNTEKKSYKVFYVR